MKSFLKKSLLVGNKKRSRLEIVATIINASENGESKTKIAKAANLNSKHLQFYLDQLVRLELVAQKKAEGKKIYIASKKGLRFLKQYDTLESTNAEVAHTPIPRKNQQSL